MHKPIILTNIDQEILASYKNVLDGLANYLGNSYEMVLHSLDNYDHSVIKIINGYHTGRSEGSPITDLALQMLEQIDSGTDGSDYYSYFSKNRRGEPLKSTTIAIRGEKHRIIGLLCINLYLNTPYIDILRSCGVNETMEIKAENFINNSESNILKTIRAVQNAVYSDRTIPKTQKNKSVIIRLYRMNLFQMKEAVDIVAKELGISKNTVYLHLRNIEGK